MFIVRSKITTGCRWVTGQKKKTNEDASQPRRCDDAHKSVDVMPRRPKDSRRPAMETRKWGERRTGPCQEMGTEQEGGERRKEKKEG